MHEYSRMTDTRRSHHHRAGERVGGVRALDDGDEFVAGIERAAGVAVVEKPLADGQADRRGTEAVLRGRALELELVAGAEIGDERVAVGAGGARRDVVVEARRGNAEDEDVIARAAGQRVDFRRAEGRGW